MARYWAWMSQENVEIVLESLRRGETNDYEGSAALMHSDISATAVRGWPEPGPFVGRDAVLAEWQRLVDWGESGFTDINVVADEGDWVIVECRWEVRTAEAESRPTSTWRSPFAYRTPASLSGTTAGAGTKPSKPPGCRSRRCPRRTWRRSSAHWKRGTAETSKRSSQARVRNRMRLARWRRWSPTTSAAS
jgi:SnoaL-like domain